jgi:hypothetical protein
MRTKTFFTPCAKFRLIVTKHAEVWSAELRTRGYGLAKAGTDVDQVTGEVFMIACQRSGDQSLMAALFAQADEAIANGEFSEVLAK